MSVYSGIFFDRKFVSQVYAVCFKRENEVFRNGKKTNNKTNKKNPLEQRLFFDLLNKFHKGAKTPNGPGPQGLYFKAGHP